MASDISPSGFPSALMKVPVQEENIGSIAYRQPLTEDMHVQQLASVPEASGAATRDPLQRDAHLTLRPPTNKQATVESIHDDNAWDEDNTDGRPSAAHVPPQLAVDLTYPPTPVTDIPAEPNLESMGLRHLRMASCFLTQFLAGWKSVQVLIFFR